MKATVYCKATAKGIHTFYLRQEGQDYFLFRQNYRRGVEEYFGNGVTIGNAFDFGKSRQNEAIQRTMQKLPSYIRYIEREYEIQVLNKTIKKNARARRKPLAA